MRTGITIVSATHVGGYKLKIKFSDGHINIYDYTSIFEKFKGTIDKFKKFKIVKSNTGIAWGNDWDMILPLIVLYGKKKKTNQLTQPNSPLHPQEHQL